MSGLRFWRSAGLRSDGTSCKNPTTTIDDVRKAFQRVKEKPHNPGLAQAFYRETFETATPIEVHRNRVRGGELQGEILRLQTKVTEIERSKNELNPLLKTAAPEYRTTVQEEIRRRQETLDQLQSEINRLTIEGRDLDKKSLDQETYVYSSELLDYLRSRGRYAVNPQSVANALAGLPRMAWRQSHLRCSPMPLNEPRLHYQVLEVISKMWKRRRGASNARRLRQKFQRSIAVSPRGGSRNCHCTSSVAPESAIDIERPMRTPSIIPNRSMR